MSPRRSSDTDACPGALRLHAAADGMLARVRLPGGMSSGAQLRALRELAEEFGDGRLELTSRANLQIRGLQPADAPALAARLRDAGLLPSPTHDNVRNIAAPPLLGPSLRALVTELDLAIRNDPDLPRLPGKFLFAIGHVPLAADLAAVPTPAGPFAIRFAGHDTGVRAESGRVAPVLIAAAHAFLAEREAQRGDGPAAWRLRELADGPARVSARLVAALGCVTVPVETAVPAGAPEPADLIGPLPQDDGLTAVAALVPLGRLDGVQVRVLEQADHLVVTPWRGVVVPDLPPEAAGAWTARLAAIDLAVEPGSPWTGVTACAGRPGCAKSLADVRADAAAAARFVDGLPVHWAGCARACGSPTGRHVRAEATPDGYLITRFPATGSDPARLVPAPARPSTRTVQPPAQAARPSGEPDRDAPARTPSRAGAIEEPGDAAVPRQVDGDDVDSGAGVAEASTWNPRAHRIGGGGSGAAGPGTHVLADVVAVARRP
ncbi:nitrite/sulfite reductase [Actinoplanes utahensis]|uniref:nitrite/sulfite reductase n=1 Tax=Actinoplanes utahensis TaxID=1869 RepID=UPI0007C66771|nr:nitrite/sulfite reductase [Actinoplanes utahensis]GIF29014.1 precorrin-3B synthase [Actinoplanes utahensis]